MKLKNKLNKSDLRKIFSSYFEPSYMGKLNNLYLLNKILILLKKNFNSTQILKEIKLSNKIELSSSSIKRIRKIAIKEKLISSPNYKDFKNKEGYLKIVPVSRYNFAPFVRQGQSIAPAGSRFKIDFKTPQGKKSKIPKKLQGIQFYETKVDAENALKDKKKFTTNFFKNEEFKKKLTIWKN